MDAHRASAKKHDKLLILVLLALSVFLGMGYYLFHSSPAVRAEVTVDGEVIEVLDLSKNQEITIRSANNGTNHLIVRDGKIWCSQASCPDNVCVHQGKQSRDGELIVCLPNLMIVRILGRD
ncbi:MAG: NusG domain II-containing protein [Lachnospiraceae bacterium]|jgi:hypothetical protein|nr:NusG domain II-containing protein [Lachnospiraceae bacterium]